MTRTQLGSGLTFSFGSPQPAGGIKTSADDYARFLRKLISGQLVLGSHLGEGAVCTNPATCPSADYTPVPGNQSWHYSLGHWVEGDPRVGGGAYSSPGAFGFYPWTDASWRFYGIVARHALKPKAYYESVRCGRLIRKAWRRGMAQTGQP